MLKKILMAFSGMILLGFIVGHLAGNLQIFLGQEALNHYAVFLRSLGDLLWVARLGLISMAILHLWMSVGLTVENQLSRPVGYARKDYIKATLASRTMIWSGGVVLAFLVYHLLHFTFLKVHPQYAHLVDAKGQRDVYSMVVLSFQQPGIFLVYIVGLFLLCFHLSHAIQSLFQTMGWNDTKLHEMLSVWGGRVAWLIFAGYASIPIAVMAGIVKLPPGVPLP
ncbi:MAG: succinate dehydrogenase cytochrome b subunit [Elusimicrobiota bacterium]|jgi:succinate dehydrogenase / fumarate reductase cytochrome b subunit